jgi:hypothetical protein
MLRSYTEELPTMRSGHSALAAAHAQLVMMLGMALATTSMSKQNTSLKGELLLLPLLPEPAWSFVICLLAEQVCGAASCVWDGLMLMPCCCHGLCR